MNSPTNIKPGFLKLGPGGPSLAPTLNKNTYLWLSSDLEDLD